MFSRPSSFVSGIVLVGALSLLGACGGPGLPEPEAPAPPATGAAATVRPSQVPSGELTLQELLRGKTSGLEFIAQGDGTERIRIRGIGSMSQTPEPLVLVDNIEIPANQLRSALAGLTRDDIRKVDVLKDVASTSGYGMRAAGGVIIIYTTRR